MVRGHRVGWLVVATDSESCLVTRRYFSSRVGFRNPYPRRFLWATLVETCLLARELFLNINATVAFIDDFLRRILPAHTRALAA